METQTVPKAEINLNATIHIHGVPEVSAKRAATCVWLDLGLTRIFFDDEAAFKAFVGEMIKAVANLK